MSGEVIRDLEFIVYNSSGEIIYTEMINDNTQVYAHTKHGATAVRRVCIRLYRTGNGFRYPRVGELDFGVVLRFDNKDIVDLNMITESDPTGKSFRLNSLKVSIVNNGEFDQLEPDSYAQYLYQRQAFEYRHGIILLDSSVEWIYCGVYYLDNWSVSDSRVEFNALGKASVLENKTYYESSFKPNTVAEMIRSVLDNAGMNYEIDSVLESSPTAPRFFGNISFRQALTILSELSCCLVYEDRQSCIQFVDLLGDGDSVDVIDYDNMFSAPKIKMGSYYNGIILKEKTLSVTNEQIAQAEEYVSGSKNIVINFDKPLYADTATYAISSGFTLSNVVYKTMYMTATLKGNGTAKISIKGDVASFAQAEKFYNAPWRDPLEPDYGYAVDLPMMIVSQNWEAFREWFLDRKFWLLKKRIVCEISWRQNPNQQVGDRLMVQANKRKKDVKMTAFMETINYKGGVLNGTTKSIGEVEL